MQNLAWVGPRAVRHQQVIAQVMAQSPVLPARFATLFSSLESLEKLLAQHHQTISQFLNQVSDQEEWALKAFLRRGQAEEHFVAQILADQPVVLSSSPGTRYLQEQKIRAQAQQQLTEHLQGLLHEIATQLAQVAADSCPRRIQSREVTGDDREMIAHWAFLVTQRSLANFHDHVQKANQRLNPGGLTLELTGPWPPYSFSPPLEMESNPLGAC
jgi:hypothetical protein